MVRGGRCASYSGGGPGCLALALPSCARRRSACGSAPQRIALAAFSRSRIPRRATMRLADLLGDSTLEDLERLAREHAKIEEQLSRPQLLATIESVLRSYRFLQE